MNRLHTHWPWILAAVCFAGYPLLRPYADESTLAGLAAMASDRWVLAHVLGMTGFVSLAVGLGRFPGRGLGALGALGVAMVLPYYGGEAFALPAIGRRAVATGDLSLLGLVDGFRYQPVAITLFGLGLVALALAGVLLVVRTPRADRRLRLATALTGLGLVLYLPQFFAPGPVRIAHGLLLAAGCLAVYFFSALVGSVVDKAATKAS